MTHRIHPTMNPVERSAPQPRFDLPVRDTQLSELSTPHNPVLLPGDLSDRSIRRRLHGTSPAFPVI
jgi:hypothetical protein